MGISLDIGKKLKELRKAKNLTLSELSEKTGLSPAYLSNIERNQTSPTLNNLFKIGGALDTDLTMIMEEAPVNQGIVVRKNDRKILFATPASNILYESITEDTHNITGICITIDENCFEEVVSTGHSDRDELGIITEGSLTMTMNNTEYLLHVGDSIFIERNTPHSYKKASPGKCIAYWFYAKNIS
ncbi:HTH-type transcriptional regulator SinR [Clostridiales bacterium]|nr:HTH-type transcriptional regulator SinR [Clostridiales bacterium]